MNSPEKRCLTVYGNETEELEEAHEFAGFDLAAFRAHFGNPDNDQLMYNEHPVNPEDVAFLSEYLPQSVIFDFDRYSYFVSCCV